MCGKTASRTLKTLMTSFSVYKNISMFCHEFIIYVVNRNYPSKIENVQKCTL